MKSMEIIFESLQNFMTKLFAISFSNLSKFDISSFRKSLSTVHVCVFLLAK
jgi:hypothetical protein